VGHEEGGVKGGPVEREGGGWRGREPHIAIAEWFGGVRARAQKERGRREGERGENYQVFATGNRAPILPKPITQGGGEKTEKKATVRKEKPMLMALRKEGEEEGPPCKTEGRTVLWTKTEGRAPAARKGWGVEANRHATLMPVNVSHSMNPGNRGTTREKGKETVHLRKGPPTSPQVGLGERG